MSYIKSILEDQKKHLKKFKEIHENELKFHKDMIKEKEKDIKETVGYLEEVEKMLNEKYSDSFIKWNEKAENCLHDACPTCNGTGLSKSGQICIHAISCPCPKCSPTY